MRCYRFLALGTLLALSHSASAQVTGPEKKDWLFLGADLGYLGVSSKVAGEVSKSGFESGLKLVGSHYFDRVVLDLGGGYLYSHVTGEGTGLTKNLKVNTRSFYAELAPRYRLNQNWQMGPVLQFLTGADVSYDENSGINELSAMWRPGARIQYELGNEDYRWRFGIQGLTNLNGRNRSIIALLFDIQFGFSIGGKAEAYPSHAPGSPSITNASPTRPRFAEGRENQIRIYLGEAVLSFPFAKSKMNAKAHEALAKLAPLLKQNEKYWGHIRVEGHSDVQGSVPRNMKLSKERATAVADRLIALGVPTERMTISGFGPTQPIDPSKSQEAFMLNRRVEIWLDDVPTEKVSELVNEFNRLDI